MKKMHYLVSAVLLLCHLTVWSTNYYVSGTGSNSNNGLSVANAFRDLQKAADLTKPGDTVLVLNGTYNNSCTVCDGINISKSGTATSYIVYKAYSGHKPKIRFTGWQGVRIWGASYIEINGFEIEGNNSSITLAYAQSQAGNVNNPTTSGNGIYMDNNGSAFPHHIRIRNNNIYNCGGHGIGSHFTDYITIENNTIYNNAWYSPLGCSGISLYQNKNFDAASGYRIIIRSNKIYNNLMNIPFFYNGKLEDGNGIIIDDAKNTQNASPHGIYTGSVKIENNLVFDNGGRGIHAYLSNNVHVVNNTTYMNCKSPQVKDGELSGYGGDNLRFYNNTTYSRTDARANHNGDGASTNIVFDYNIYYNFNTSKPITKGPNDIVADPKFVNASVTPALANFKLQANSPGINSGTTTLAPSLDIENVSRPKGGIIDRGAYEYNSTTNQAPTVNITAPNNNASFVVATAVTVTASATDSDGSISKVEFFQGSTKIGEDVTSPYSISWMATTAGTYILTAKATDNAAASTLSAPVTAVITNTTNQAPTVNITAPSNNASFVVGTAVTVTASATDSDGSISKVEFFQGSIKIGEDATSPYSISWTATTAGTYILTAKATDNAAASTLSAPVTVSLTVNTSNCIQNPIPDASKWVLRNNWNDQSNGSKVTNTSEALQVIHRAWGNSYLWVIESGSSNTIVAGKTYHVNFDFKDDANVKLSSVQVGLSTSVGSGGDPALLQPAVTVAAGYSSAIYTSKSVSFVATTTGTAYLSFKLNWAAQPSLQVNDLIKNISICTGSAAARISEEEVNNFEGIYPNPTSDHISVRHAFTLDQAVEIQLMDVTGLVLHTYISYGTESALELGSNISSGLYLLKVKGIDSEKVYRFVKE